MKTFLRTSIEKMLHGLVCWLVYRDVAYKNKVDEAVAVDDTFRILQVNYSNKS